VISSTQRESYAEPAMYFYFASVLLWLFGMWYGINVSQNPAFQRFAWGVTGGTLTGIQCFVKDALTILSLTSSIWRLPWIFYVLLFLGIAMAAGGLAVSTLCMKRFDATYCSAMNAAALVLSATVMGAVHYDDFGNLDSVHSYVLYPLGLLIILWGLYVLDVVSSEKKEHDDYDDDAELDDVSMEHTPLIIAQEESESYDSIR